MTFFQTQKYFEVGLEGTGVGLPNLILQSYCNTFIARSVMKVLKPNLLKYRYCRCMRNSFYLNNLYVDTICTRYILKKKHLMFPILRKQAKKLAWQRTRLKLLDYELINYNANARSIWCRGNG